MYEEIYKITYGYFNKSFKTHKWHILFSLRLDTRGDYRHLIHLAVALWEKIILRKLIWSNRINYENPIVMKITKISKHCAFALFIQNHWAMSWARERQFAAASSVSFTSFELLLSLFTESFCEILSFVLWFKILHEFLLSIQSTCTTHFILLYSVTSITNV